MSRKFHRNLMNIVIPNVTLLGNMMTQKEDFWRLCPQWNLESMMLLIFTLELFSNSSKMLLLSLSLKILEWQFKKNKHFSIVNLKFGYMTKYYIVIDLELLAFSRWLFWWTVFAFSKYVERFKDFTNYCIFGNGKWCLSIII